VHCTDARRVALRELVDFDWIMHIMDFLFPDDDADAAEDAAEDAASDSDGDGSDDGDGAGASAAAAPNNAGPPGDATDATVLPGSHSVSSVAAAMLYGNDSEVGTTPPLGWVGTNMDVRANAGAHGGDMRVIGEDNADDEFFDLVEGTATATAGVGGAEAGAEAVTMDGAVVGKGRDATHSGSTNTPGDAVPPAPSPAAAAGKSFTLTRLFINFFRSAAVFTPSEECSTQAMAALSLGSLRVGSNILSTSKKQVCCAPCAMRVSSTSVHQC